ncbi:hypothetical protein NLI96_g7919 [Meripilus lineatus]|uniref:Uncharacterized protein n=1 Tax=Meripilus lineatus TaxID=2056292 RepID=A0AAD5V2Y5_9APHY|nr:hypothetical protein NLI96_g7919 [Physisporinus lineatus]
MTPKRQWFTLLNHKLELPAGQEECHGFLSLSLQDISAAQNEATKPNDERLENMMNPAHISLTRHFGGEVAPEDLEVFDEAKIWKVILILFTVKFHGDPFIVLPSVRR